MRKTLKGPIGAAMMLSVVFNSGGVEPVWEYAVQLSANVQVSPPQITLNWPADTVGLPNSYEVYRKAPDATSWGNGTVLPGSATSFTDNNVTLDGIYEYQVAKAAPNRNGYGYLRASVRAPLVDNRGKVLLVVDNTYASQLAAELNR